MRYGDGKKRVLWFDQSIEFPLLIRKISAKLGVTHEMDTGDCDLSKLFLLRQENEDTDICQTSSVEYGDELVLEKRNTLSSDGIGDSPLRRTSRSNSVHGIGTIVRKKIDDKYYEGEVVAYDSVKIRYKIRYTNSNEEEFDEADMKLYYKHVQRYSHAKFEAAPETTMNGSNPIKSEETNPDDTNVHSGSTQGNGNSINQEDAVKKEDVDEDDINSDSEFAEKNEAPIKKGDADDSDVISISSDEDEESSYNDGTEEEYESSSSEDERASNKHSYDYDSGEDCNPRRVKRTKRNPKKPVESPLEVRMDNRDIPSAPGKPNQGSEKKESDDEMEEKSMLVNGAGKKKAEQKVKLRIIKLLNTGFHDQSNEHEAKNAMKLAQRLMRKHNLSQALLLKEREANNSKSAQDDEVLKGGMVRVKIFNRKTGKASLFTRWLSRLLHPICNNFGVQHFSQCRRGVCCEVVFYGIYSNAQLAGYAYKVAAERIAQMMVEYKPEATWRNISTKSSRLSYAIGITHGISEDVQRNLAREKEQRKRKLERARLAGSRGEAYEESDEEDFGIDDNEGSGITLAREEISSNRDAYRDPLPPNKGNSQTKSISGIDLQNRVEELEKEEQAALVLVDHNKKLAEEVLEEHNIKLKSGRKRKPIRFDRQSYEVGIEDAKEIDINQRAIRDEVKVKVEKTEN